MRKPVKQRLKKLVRSQWRRANARNVSFQSLYGGQFTLSAELIDPKFCVKQTLSRVRK